MDHKYLIKKYNINKCCKYEVIVEKLELCKKNKTNSRTDKMSNIKIKRRKRRIMYTKAQHMFINNREMLVKFIFDGNDITSEALDLLIFKQFDFWSNLFKPHYDNRVCYHRKE